MTSHREGKRMRTFIRNFVHIEQLLLEKDGEVELALPKGHSSSYALYSVDGFKNKTSIVLPGKTLKGLMHMNHHQHIDMLKLDIEGSEFAVVDSWLEVKLPPVCQILIELHDRVFEEGLELSKELFKTLKILGFNPIDVHFGTNDPDGAVSFFNIRACCKIREKLCQMEKYFTS
jgi:FkbM family methyltransferase